MSPSDALAARRADRFGSPRFRTGPAIAAVWIFLIPTNDGARADGRQRVLADLGRMDAEKRDAAAWNERRAILREEFLKGARLWPLPRQGPISIARRDLRTHDGYCVENVAIETLPGFYCTGNLYRPVAAPRQSAGVLCPHGHFKPLGRFRADQQIRCAHLARMGATVFSYGMVGWQDSRQTTHDDPLVLALQTWNSLKALDFLCSLDGVDAKRIGMTGASGGGTQTLYLALLDERVKAAAPIVILYPWTVPEGCCRCEGGMPVMQASHSNCIEFAAAIAPRAQLIISVGGDQTRDFPEAAFPFVRRAYKAYGAVDAVENVHLPAERHDFGPSKRAAVYLFLSRHLGLEHRAEELGRITVEEPRQMEVFNAAHPLPAGAVSGSAAVARAFESLRRP